MPSTTNQACPSPMRRLAQAAARESPAGVAGKVAWSNSTPVDASTTPWCAWRRGCRCRRLSNTALTRWALRLSFYSDGRRNAARTGHENPRGMPVRSHDVQGRAGFYQATKRPTGSAPPPRAKRTDPGKSTPKGPSVSRATPETERRHQPCQPAPGPAVDRTRFGGHLTRLLQFLSTGD